MKWSDMLRAMAHTRYMFLQGGIENKLSFSASEFNACNEKEG